MKTYTDEDLEKVIALAVKTRRLYVAKDVYGRLEAHLEKSGGVSSGWGRLAGVRIVVGDAIPSGTIMAAEEFNWAWEPFPF